jgi:hypothetical protein
MSGKVAIDSVTASAPSGFNLNHDTKVIVNRVNARAAAVPLSGRRESYAERVDGPARPRIRWAWIPRPKCAGWRTSTPAASSMPKAATPSGTDRSLEREGVSSPDEQTLRDLQRKMLFRCWWQQRPSSTIRQGQPRLSGPTRDQGHHPGKDD